MPISNVSPLLFNQARLAALESDTVANIAVGGQLGLGAHLINIDAATPLILPPIVPVVVHMPTMFANIPNYAATLKALAERHAKTIDGIDFGYTLETEATPAGHDGQTLKMPTNARRGEVNPSMTFSELSGNLVWKFFMNWMHMIKSPDTQAATLSGLSTNANALPPQTLSVFSMDVLFIQYDTTLRPENVLEGFMITGMFPIDIGSGGFKREIGQSTMPERTIQFTGIVQHNDATRQKAKDIAALLALHSVNYRKAEPVAAAIEAALAQQGVQREVQESTAWGT